MKGNLKLKDKYTVVSPYNEKVASGLSFNDANGLKERLQTFENFHHEYTKSTYPFYIIKEFA